MHIGIDGNEANVEQHVGVSVYTLKLLEYFQKQATTDLHFTVYLRSEPLATMPKGSDFFEYQVVKGPALWRQIIFPLYLAFHKKPDVFFAPAHYAPAGYNNPLVVTIHDLSYFYYPNEFLAKDLFKLKNWTEEAVKSARKVIAVSKTTKKDILKFYSLPEDKVKVVYNGFEKKPPENLDNSVVLSKFNIERGKYLLYVGTIQPRKNISVLIRALPLISEIAPDMKLVITGKKGWMYESILEEAKQNNMSDKIIFTDFVTDDELAVLYYDAFSYVQPSFYEGFGIPLLEAMANSCPVIASIHASLPEIGGEACLYFDPDEAEDLAERIKELYGNENKRTELIEKGKKRITYFSWESCGKETLEVLKSAV
jgi:glycosyltransferase involved in cell wall biosynthesis